MAFASMMIIFLVIGAILVGLVGLIGLIMIIVSLVRRGKFKREGRKPKKLGLIIGIVLFCIPIGIVIAIVGSIVVSGVKTNIARKSYNNCIEQWRNEWVTDNEACEAAIEELLTAADEGDIEALKALFPKEAQGENLDEQIEAFLEEYPKGLSEIEERNDQSMGSSGSNHYGSHTEDCSSRYEIVMDGQRYYLNLSIRYQCDEDSDQIGVTLFTVESEKAYVLEKEYGDDDYIFADTVVEEEFETRRIDGHPYRFTEIDRAITVDEALKTMKTERSIGSFIEKYGEPNVKIKYSNCTGTDYYYELKPEDGELRYLHITAVDDRILPDSCHISGEEEDVFWLDENGEPEVK